jgi:hypothetical protein
MRCDVMRCDAMRCDAMRCDAMRCDAMRCDSSWRLHDKHSILFLSQSPEIATLLAPVHSSQAYGASSGSTPGNSGATSPERAVKGDVLGQGVAGKAAVGGEQGTPGKFEVQVPRVVTEDAKFLHLDGRINELESKAAGGGGEVSAHRARMRMKRFGGLQSFENFECSRLEGRMV